MSKSISEEYMDIMAEEIKNEIDNEIISKMLMETLVTNDGWTRVNIMKFPFNNTNIIQDTSAWIHCNATGDYKYHNGCWYLENAQDATALILKFS